MVHTGNVNSTSSWQSYHTVITDDSLKPSYHATAMGRDGSCLVRMEGDTGKVGFKNIRNASETINGIFTEIVWAKR